MITTDLQFTQAAEDRFISNAIVPNGDTAIELKFAGGENSVKLEKSLTGDNWSSFYSYGNAEEVFQLNINGVLPAQKIRVICSSQPILAKYLQNE